MAMVPADLDNLDQDERRRLAATGAWADSLQKAAVVAVPGDGGGSDNQSADDPQKVVFVDASLASTYSAIDNTGVATLVLDDSDGLQQIADYLAGQHFTRLTTIGIAAPGDGGTLQIGGTALSSANLDQFSKPLAEIGAAVQPGGQLIVDNTAIGGNPDGRDLLSKLSSATNLRVGAPIAGAASQADGSSDPASAGGADPQIWVGLFPGLVVHADNPGNNTATNITTLYGGSTSFSNFFHRLDQVQLDPVHGFYFALDDSGGGASTDRILEGTLSQALNGTGPNFTTVYADAAAGDLITNIAIDETNRLIYFTDNNSSAGTASYFERMNYDGSNRVTLATFTGVIPEGGLALDLAHSKAYFTFGRSNSSGSTSFVNTANRLYVASGVTPSASSVTLAQLGPADLTSGRNFIEGLTIDPSNQVLYYLVEGTAGGVLSYHINTSAFGTVWSQVGVPHTTANAWEALQYITFDPGSGEYYVSEVGGTPTAQSTFFAGVFVGSTVGGAPTLFLNYSNTTGGSIAPLAIYIDDFPTVTASNPTVSFTEGGSSVLIDSALSVTKPDTTLLASASVVIGGFVSGDTLTATTVGSITGSFSNGTLTLTGVDTLADYQSVLDSVKFSTTSDTSSNLTRTLTFTVSDGLLTGSATDTVTIVPVAEAPTFGGPTTFSGSEEATIALSGITATGDSDDTLGTTATISGVAPGWTVFDGSTSLTASGGTVTLPTADLGALNILAPDAGTGATDTLTLTVTSHEGSSTTVTATETIVVSTTAGPPEQPTVSTADTTMTVGATSAALTISVAASDADDTLGLVTISGLPSGFSLSAGTDQGGGTWTESAGDLPGLAIIAPSNDSATTLTLTVTAVASENGSSTSATTVHVDIEPPCYCRGTRILTADGEMAVEELAIGDRVVTISGAARPIKWIGRRAFDGRFIAGNLAVLPIRVMAGAIADGVPARDLWVSPGHALAIDGVLVQAEHLINGATIAQPETADEVEYFHIELEAHDIIFADGAPAETYVECDNRGQFHNAGEFAALYPEDRRPGWQYCAPLLEWYSAELTAIRAALFERAEALGRALDSDPDLHLVVDGRVVRPEVATPCLYRFAVPAGSAALSLASRRTVPAEIVAASRDTRRLGVPVEHIVMSDAGLRVEIGHRHGGLREGFHDDEGGHRWTDGMARLPDELLRPFGGAITLEIQLIENGLRYPREMPAANHPASSVPSFGLAVRRPPCQNAVPAAARIERGCPGHR
jgi:hypothetical protein